MFMFVLQLCLSKNKYILYLAIYESKKNTADYHDEMNGDTFYDWFSKILPLLRENAIIVMD